MSITKKTVKGKDFFQFRVYYTDSLGKRKQYNSKLFDRRKDCKLAESEFITGITTKKINKPFKEVCYDWLEYTKEKRNEKTHNNLESFINSHLSFLFDVRISDFTLAYCKSVKDTLGKDSLSVALKNKAISIIKNVLTHACLYYDLKSNNMTYIQNFNTRKEEKEKDLNVITFEEFQKFYNWLCTNKVKHSDIFYFLFFTGLRKNECLALTFEDFSNGSITINKQINQSKKVLAPLKTKASYRTISLNDKCIEIIQKRKEMYKDIKGFNDSWFVFGGFSTLSHATLNYHISAYLKEFPDHNHFSVHSLRHSHATYLISKGIDIYKISKRLGHENISITMETYIHFIDTKEDDILNILNESEVNKT